MVVTSILQIHTMFCPANLPEFRWPFGLWCSEERVRVLQSTAEGDFTVRPVAVHLPLAVWQHFGHGYTQEYSLLKFPGKVVWKNKYYLGVDINFILFKKKSLFRLLSPLQCRKIKSSLDPGIITISPGRIVGCIWREECCVRLLVSSWEK